jgi:hypothetical protein
MEVGMATEELPVPENEEALDDFQDELESLDEEDDVDKPETNLDEYIANTTNVPNEDLEEDDPSEMPEDVGNDEHGDWDPDKHPDTAVRLQRISHLSAKQRTRARRIAVRAAILGKNHAGAIHYTQGGSRWQGIADTRYSHRNQYPNYADCSAYVTWCLWNGLYVPYRKPDVVNGASWRAGYTGTMLAHGRAIRRLNNVRWADCVIYGAPGSTGRHVAIVVKTSGGTPMVVSHGSEGGPYYLPYNYRRDIQSIRRYIHYRV